MTFKIIIFKLIYMISVIIPTFNRQDLLKKSVEAILNNSLLPDEILVIEQGNIEYTKNTLSIFFPILKVKKIELKIFHFQEKSASKARNFWVSKASQDIIFFIDDDLEILQNYIETAYNYLKNNPKVKIVSGKDKNAKIPKNSFFKQLIRVLTYQDIFWNKRIVLKNGQNIVRIDFDKVVDSQWASWTMVVRKEVFEKFSFSKNFEKWSYGEDVFFSYQVFKKYWKWSVKFMSNLVFNHIKSDINKVSWLSQVKMMIIYRYIFWKTCIYNNSLFNLFLYIYWEFFRWLFIARAEKIKLNEIFKIWKYLIKNYKKIDTNSINFNKYIFEE